jgi:hypothetical protein
MRTFASDDEAADAGIFKEVTCIRQTPKAILCRFKDGKERWVPQSCVHEDSEVWNDGDTGKLVVKAWFAEKMKL